MVGIPTSLAALTSSPPHLLTSPRSTSHFHGKIIHNLESTCTTSQSCKVMEYSHFDYNTTDDEEDDDEVLTDDEDAEDGGRD